MKNASSAAQAILATGQAVLAELYDITLTTGQVYHFTSFPVPLTTSIYWPPAGPFTYKTGLVIKRGNKTQKAGTDGGSMKVSLSPNYDSPNAPVLINGYPLLMAARLGILDNATVQLSKLFMSPPGVTGFLDTSPGATGDFKGIAQDVQADRLKVDITIDNYLALMGNQQMPRVLFGVGCWHQVYDTGCTLLKSAFTSNGIVGAVTDSAHFDTNLTQADEYFQLGVMTFTSGVNKTFASNVADFRHSGGAIVTNYPFPQAPAPGDTFTIYPGCDLQQATCSGKFGNLAHFGGQPDIPVPETNIDGGTNAPPAQAAGAQAGQLIGSMPSSQGGFGRYKT